MDEPPRPAPQDRLRLTDSLLCAIEDSISLLQRLVSEVRKEIDLALHDEGYSARDQEICALRREAEQLRQGMASRAVIERAKGILMQSHALSETEAFDFLTRMSQRRQRKLRDVAADVVSEFMASRLDVDPSVVAPSEGAGTEQRKEDAADRGSVEDEDRGDASGLS